jgi:predicted chitinase
MSYIDSLSATQKKNVDFIIKRMNAEGITNPYTQAGILAVISKESSFLPKSEKAYSNTANDRIRMVFSRTKKLSDHKLSAIKADPKKFFDLVYDGRIGNKTGEGYKFRGRGLNQLTGRANYETHNKYTDVDIVKNPDKVNDFPVAVDVVLGYFKRAFEKTGNKLADYGMKDMNDAKNIASGVGVAYHANTGWGKSKSQIDKETTGGHKKAVERAPEFVELTKSLSGKKVGSGGKKKILLTLGVAALIVGTYLVITRIKKRKK